MPRFAANLTMMFNEWSFLDRFAAAADVGFDAVEFLFPYDFTPDEVAERLQRNKLTPALFNGPPGDWDKGERGFAARPDQRAAFEASIDTALVYVRATGVKRLHVMAGLAPAQDPAAMAAYERALLFASDRADEAGIDIVIEPINPRDVPGYFLNNFDVAADIVRRLARPNLKLQFDIYHRQIIHGDVTRGLEAMMPIIGHIQVASVPERHEPCSGELDDARVFGVLDRLGYAGFVGCEYRPAGKTLDGLGWLSGVRR
ncbi:TIM barrel protein [Bradyrhizobium sp. U87765 SZCCT0131]|uniref:2-oxo-tetronate isomerase n=1 Tax=unclassified Bradyrhizobium TaxID=2631580 RepID=UPI001BACB4D4|nr:MULTISPECIES: 2-oxo-tetronate isomerase [unclassified Bradyrhizobium]MBR1221029.1 TIM barrel protein [Bradyrhizobium sp. U87765 SZCCT0131]MBR1260151.1 TIM barrel protein [Bradyrhizobium sp. U87765 SZCCT0134]MBR1307600.1 TIM barrel protein [Bradyrhizobium sp. U87765 SZCCT0110]MBR1321554.1 TIM barrel protein [Bradyrhizobium sp. U87765 SZCCT0109]MBR1349867.1 TIM barrel protein [Bradyrhizobium sp. U87765 SZCCT0048]